MKRTTLLGSVAAGLMAAAVATPAWAQATTYPAGTDCTALSSAASRAECTNQMNESRQTPAPGENVQQDSNTPATTGEAPAGTGATSTGTSPGVAAPAGAAGAAAPSSTAPANGNTGTGATNTAP